MEGLPAALFVDPGAMLGAAAASLPLRPRARGWAPCLGRSMHAKRVPVVGLCYVSSLHDEVNLVAKELVAARHDLGGALVVSRFTGAARELTAALVVNPDDLQQTSDALRAALFMPGEERRDRMKAMRRVVAQDNAYRWAGRMLVDAVEARRRERLADRFSWGGPSAAAGIDLV